MKQNKKTLTVIGIIGGIAVLSLFGASFLGFKVYSQYALLGSLTAELEGKRAEEGILGDMRRLLADTEEKRKSFDSFLISSGGEADFIESLEKRGLEEGVDLTIGDVSLTAGPPGSQFDTLNVGFEITGTFGRVYNFLALLENEPKAITIKAVSFRWLSEENDKSRWMASIDMSVIEEKSK